MANIFPKSSNVLVIKLAVALVSVGAVVAGLVWYYFTPKYTRVGYEPQQPVSYSHALHVGQLGMDCRYCHSFVDQAAASNIPTTQTCMNCHNKIQKGNPKLKPLQDSWDTGEPMRWVKIHNVPDYAYFNHAVHVNRGVSCASCHGKINEMEVVYHDKPLSMAWCLECHRAPENHLRPLSQVYNLDWSAGEKQKELGNVLKEKWNINPPLHCGGCHR
jgi:ferredoxin